MIDVTTNKNSSAVNNFYTEVLRHASKASKSSEISKETFTQSIAKVAEEKLKNCEKTVENIINVQFKAGDQVPLSFFLSIGFVNRDMLSKLSNTLLEKFVEEGRAL